jgi:FeS assembly SUF system protein
MRLLDRIFGKKSIGNKTMNEIQTPDDMQATNPVRSGSDQPLKIESAIDSATESATESASDPAPDAAPDTAPDTRVESTAGAESTAGSPTGESSPEHLKDLIVEQLKTVFDPEIPVNIYEMGLIYDVDVDPGGATRIRMTLTTPMCPAAEELPPEVESKAREVEGVTSVQLDLVWEPPWTPDMMSEAARLDLGMM